MSLDRRLWTDQEDQHILRLVNKYGTKKWPIISQKLCNQTAFERTGKQCRQRWYNHLNPEINNANWSQLDQQKLFEAHLNYGNKWKYISRQFPGRTDNSIKNHFYSTIRKCLRRINKLHGQKNSTLKMRNIKPYVLSKILADKSKKMINKDLTQVILQLGKNKPNKMKKQNKSFNLQQLNDKIQKLYKLNEQYQQKKNTKKSTKKGSHDLIGQNSQQQSQNQSNEVQKIEVCHNDKQKQMKISQQKCPDISQDLSEGRRQKLNNYIWSFKKRKRITSSVKFQQNHIKSYNYNYQELNEVLKKDEFKRFKKSLNYMKLNDGILCEAQRHSSLDETNYDMQANKKHYSKNYDNLFDDDEEQQRQQSIQEQFNENSKDQQFKTIFNHDFLQAHSIGHINLSNPSPAFSKSNSMQYDDLIVIGTHIKIFNNLDGQVQKINNEINRQQTPHRDKQTQEQFIQQILQINFDPNDMFGNEVIQEISDEKQ